MVKITPIAALTLVAAAASPVLSTVVITKPVASTDGSGGKALDVAWKDDGSSPNAAAWGDINIYLATGSHDVQYKLQTLASGVAYSKNSASYNIDASVGANGGYYFLRFEGTNDSNGIPPMAFSARFSLDNMTGSFNSTVQAQLTSAGLGSSTGASTATGTVSSAASASKGSSTSSTMAKSTSTLTVSASAARSTTSTSSTSGASKMQFATYASALVAITAVSCALL